MKILKTFLSYHWKKFTRVSYFTRLTRIALQTNKKAKTNLTCEFHYTVHTNVCKVCWIFIS